MPPVPEWRGGRGQGGGGGGPPPPLLPLPSPADAQQSATMGGAGVLGIVCVNFVYI